MTTILNSELINELTAFFLRRDSWQDWTPTITQSGNVTVTVNYARYVVLAQSVIVRAKLTVTGSGTAGNAVVIGGIPTAIQPANSGGLSIIGIGNIQDSGTAQYVGALWANTASDWRLIAHNQTNFVGVTPSFALANGDIIGFQAAYER